MKIYSTSPKLELLWESASITVSGLIITPSMRALFISCLGKMRSLCGSLRKLKLWMNSRVLLLPPPPLMPMDYKDEPLQLPTFSSEGGDRVIQGNPQKVISATASLYSFFFHYLYKLLFISSSSSPQRPIAICSRMTWSQSLWTGMSGCSFGVCFFVGVAQDVKTIPFVSEHRCQDYFLISRCQPNRMGNGTQSNDQKLNAILLDIKVEMSTAARTKSQARCTSKCSFPSRWIDLDCLVCGNISGR